MYILGISAFYHDSAACLLKDGKILVAVQEERLSRKRHDPGFPRLAIQSCLEQAGITIDDIDLVAYYEKPFLKFERILETLLNDAPGTYGLALKALPVWLTQKLWMRKTLWRELERKVPVIFTTHHEAHAASCFYPSPFQKAAILTVDGVGEWTTTSWGIGAGNKVDLKAEIRYPHSLGLLYSAFTQYLGFRVNSAEYKVMGLAPYGEPKYVDLIKDNIIEIFEDGSYLLNMDYFAFSKIDSTISNKFDTLFGEPRRRGETELKQFHTDIARSIQAITEEVMFKLATHIHHQTKIENLCLAGGVALNCVSNGNILRNGPYKNVWIQPAAGDCGGALGAAFVAWHGVKKMPRPVSIGDTQQGSFLGPEFGEDAILSEIEALGLLYDKYEPQELIQQVSHLLESKTSWAGFKTEWSLVPERLGIEASWVMPETPKCKGE